MVLGKLPVPGRPTILITVGQGPNALAVAAGGGGLDIFILIYPFSPLSPSLWETARYRLKYCLKGPLNPKQPTNQPINHVQLHVHWGWSAGAMVLGKLPVPGRPTYLDHSRAGWSGGAMVLGKLPVPGRSTLWMIVGQGPNALAVGAGGGCSEFFLSPILSLPFLPLSGRRPDID